MKQLWVYVCVIGVWVGSVAWAQLPQIEDYSGDLWSRPALTGDWGGFRNTMAKRGINLDVDLVQGVLGLNSGGSFRNHDSIRYPYGGHAEYVSTSIPASWACGRAAFSISWGKANLARTCRGNTPGRCFPPTPRPSTPCRSMRRPRSPASSSPNFWPSGSASTWASSTPSAAI